MADEMDYMEQAKELADSYRLLVHRRDMLRQQYEDSRSWFYTKDEIIYKLSQGAHEESERVQTSGTSNPVERTVLNCDKVLASMNREVQTQRTEQFLEPYYKVCEDIELFEVGLRSLRGCTRIVAEQLFVDGRKQSEMLNLHATFTKGTIEFRLFQFADPADGKRNGLHAGEMKAYIQLCLAMSQLAKMVRTASPKPQQTDNEKYAMRCWMLRLGFIGDEFATAREILLRNMEGNASWRNK